MVAQSKLAPDGDSGLPPSPSLLLNVLPHVFDADPTTVSACLGSGNSDVYRTACAHLYRELEVEVAVAGTLGLSPMDTTATALPCCPARAQKAKLLALLRSPSNAAHVRVLRFAHPCPTHIPTDVNQAARSIDRIEAWEFAANLLDHMPGIEELVWETGFGVGGALWKSISSLRNLRKLTIRNPPLHPGEVNGPPVYPRITMDPQVAIPPGFDLHPVDEEDTQRPRAIGLGGQALGIAWEDLEELRLEGLSGAGARSLGTHLQILSQLDFGPQPRLHTLTLSTHFLDTRLCESIGAFGALRSLRHLTLGTSGLKFTADCLRTIVEECSVLESLRLSDVEGRLGKNPWGQINHWPSTFRSLQVDVSEIGSHHSWVLDHLGSIQEVPLRQLTTFSVRRLVHPVAALPFPPHSVAVPQRVATHTPGSIPDDLLETLCEEGSGLEELCLDWWELAPSQVEQLVTSCPNLCKLQIAVKGAFVDIISMSNAFGHVPDLVELNVTSEPKYNTCGPKGKVKKRKDNKEEVDLPLFLAEKLAEAEADGAVVDLRDLRKFLRRMPNFRVLRWIGRGGKGEWRVTSSKRSTLIPIEFVHSAILQKQTWLDCQRKPPSFEFDDEVANTKVLELPPSPDRHSPTELPTLSRTTTGSSTSLMTATTPPSPMVRRPSGTNSLSNSGVLGIECDTLPSPTATTAPWGRRSSTSAPRRLSNADDMKLEIRTGKLEIRTSPGANSEPRRLRDSRSPTKASGRSNGTNGSNGTSLPASPATSRHAPGSTSPKKMSLPPPTSPVKKPIRICPDGWTTVGGDSRGRK